MTINPVSDGSLIVAPLINSIANAAAPEGIVSGCAPSKGSGDWDVDIASGRIRLTDTNPSVSATAKTITDPASDPDLDSGEFRVDLITIDSTPTVNVTEGSPATKPNAPNIPANEVLVATILISGDASSLTSADIDDHRIFVENISPVRVTEEAVTFAESGVTITHDSTEVTAESVALLDYDGTTATRPADNNSGSTSGGSWAGLVINPNTALDGVRLTISENSSGFNQARLRNNDTSTTLQTKDVSSLSATDTFDFIESLSSGTNYTVELRHDTSSWTRGYYDSPSFPYTSTDIDITNGIFGGSTTNDALSFTDVQGLTEVLSGSPIIEWDSGVPTDIKSWDLATYQRTLDGETVTIDILDSTDAVLFSNVSQNFDISTVSTSENVKIRANLSRADTANNPTLDYAARRFVR